MIDALVALGVFIVAFLLGSIPWGLIISKVFYHTDIREHGSGNIGTTNAMRTMAKAEAPRYSCSISARASRRASLAWVRRRF